nr:hypothetical protein [Micromonospora sp. DSM 115978]
TDLDRRLAIHPFVGRDELSLYDHWADGYRTLHGTMTHGFPNQFFTGYIQGGITAAVPAMFEQQAVHIAHIISQAFARGAQTVEPTAEAQDEWVATIRANEFDNTNFQRECTPGYYNNEGEQRIRSVLGDPYWPGFYAMEDLLQAWRDAGDLAGLALGK